MKRSTVQQVGFDSLWIYTKFYAGVCPCKREMSLVAKQLSHFLWITTRFNFLNWVLHLICYYLITSLPERCSWMVKNINSVYILQIQGQREADVPVDCCGCPRLMQEQSWQYFNQTMIHSFRLICNSLPILHLQYLKYRV